MCNDKEIMTLNEAILHAEEKAQSLCGECAIEHKQLAEWLRELKASKNTIAQLAKDNVVLAKEKDALIKDLDFLKAHPHGACVICRHNAFSPTKDGSRCMVCDYGGNFIKFEWRGVTE